MSLLAPALIALTLLPGLQAPAAARPDFSGHWVMVSPPELASLPGQEQRVKQDAETLSILGPDGSTSFVFKLDGKQHDFTGGDITRKVSAAWEGARLRLVVAGGDMTSISVWSLDGQGQLTIESRVEPQGMGMTMVFRKKTVPAT